MKPTTTTFTTSHCPARFPVRQLGTLITKAIHAAVVRQNSAQRSLHRGIVQHDFHNARLSEECPAHPHFTLLVEARDLRGLCLAEWLWCGYRDSGEEGAPLSRRAGELAKGWPATAAVVRLSWCTFRSNHEEQRSSRALTPCPGPHAPQERKPSPLQRGGTLQGAAAAGKDASEKFKSMAEGKATTGPVMQVSSITRCWHRPSPASRADHRDTCGCGAARGWELCGFPLEGRPLGPVPVQVSGTRLLIPA